ncbi:hypothetical protein BIW11_05005 [Tropilaelaps mercedesae]|uniref:Uncharacterized protein n=1 Tax=Tropilaelaps mercedesae TaxID=418985 RepID=A0A1V9WYP0_9ACAR|nr:hypothetical protein BIW11_05005 [Tropilaelaps mercedesae]
MDKQEAREMYRKIDG